MSQPEKKRLSIRRLLLFLILGVVLSYHLIWAVNYLSYQRYMDALPGNHSPVAMRKSYFSAENDVVYYVKRPDYLTLDGNLVCSTKDDSISILAWPNYLCRDIDCYGLMMQDPETKHGYMFYVDENMEFLPENYTNLSLEIAADAEKMFNQHKSEVLELFQLMQEEFKFDKS